MTRPPVQRFAKAIVESTDFSALGTQDRLVLIGFDPRIAGGDTDRRIGSPIQASLRSPNLTSNTLGLAADVRGAEGDQRTARIQKI